MKKTTYRANSVDDRRQFTIINMQGRRRLKDLLPLPKPLSVFIEPTNVCNFRCVCCGHGQDQNRKDLQPIRHMEMELFRKLVRELRDWPGQKLKLLRLALLGEPFTHPGMLEMVRLAKEAGVAEKIDTFSNGSLLTEEISAKLVEYGLDAIRFSIYAVSEDRHRRVAQTRVGVDAIYRNIKRLREIRDASSARRPYIFVKMFDTYGSENDDFLRMYEPIADEVGLEQVHNATKYNTVDLVAAYYNDEKLEERTVREYQQNLHEHVACPKPFMSLVINNIGSVLMCTHDLPKATKIGDATTATLQSIWDGQELFEFRKMHLLGRKHENMLCRNCDWYKLLPEEDNVDGIPVEQFLPRTGAS